MRLRREQGLLVAVALLSALIWFNREGDPTRLQVRPPLQVVEDLPMPTTPLTPGGVGDAARLELFREPSESAALPPRPLPPPPASALPVVWLPLTVGQHAPAYRQLRGPGEVKEQVDVVDAGGGDVLPPPETGDGSAQGSGTQGNGAQGSSAQGNGARASAPLAIRHAYRGDPSESRISTIALAASFLSTSFLSADSLSPAGAGAAPGDFAASALRSAIRRSRSRSLSAIGRASPFATKVMAAPYGRLAPRNSVEPKPKPPSSAGCQY